MYVSHPHTAGLNFQWDGSTWFLVKAQMSQVHQSPAKSICVGVFLPSVKVEKEIARQKRLRNISYRLLRADWHEEPDENWKERACMWEEGSCC